MSILKEQDGKKWVNFLLVTFSIVLGAVVYKFSLQLGEWFDFEAKISNFGLISQGVSVGVAILGLFVTFRNKKAMLYLDEVFTELLKVIWPDKESTFKLTIGIVIALVITGIFFGLIDLGLSKLLGLLYR